VQDGVWDLVFSLSLFSVFLAKLVSRSKGRIGEEVSGSLYVGSLRRKNVRRMLDGLSDKVDEVPEIYKLIWGGKGMAATIPFSCPLFSGENIIIDKGMSAVRVHGRQRLVIYM
jgi:hypothetical protein